MNSDTFYEIEENLVHLNAAFLKSSRYWGTFSMICLSSLAFIGHEIKKA
jgi:hypothetical protein